MKIRPILFMSLLVCVVGMLGTQNARGKTAIKVTEIHSENSPLITFRVILRAGSINDTKASPISEKILNEDKVIAAFHWV